MSGCEGVDPDVNGGGRSGWVFKLRSRKAALVPIRAVAPDMRTLHWRNHCGSAGRRTNLEDLDRLTYTFDSQSVT